MSIELTEQQRQAIMSGEAIRIAAPEIGGEMVLLRAETYEKIQELSEGEREKAAWAQLARKAANRWGQEHPF